MLEWDAYSPDIHTTIIKQNTKYVTINTSSWTSMDSFITSSEISPHNDPDGSDLLSYASTLSSDLALSTDATATDISDIDQNIRLSDSAVSTDSCTSRLSDLRHNVDSITQNSSDIFVTATNHANVTSCSSDLSQNVDMSTSSVPSQNVHCMTCSSCYLGLPTDGASTSFDLFRPVDRFTPMQFEQGHKTASLEPILAEPVDTRCSISTCLSDKCVTFPVNSSAIWINPVQADVLPSSSYDINMQSRFVRFSQICAYFYK